MKQLYTTKEHFDDFWAIVQRHIIHKFEWHKLTLDDYLKMGTIERANKFALPKGLLERMGRFIDETGTYQRHAMQFIRQLEEQGKIIYHAKVTRCYTSSGKRFDLPPWIEITPYQLQALLAANKAGKFELTPRQKKLVKRYFPRKEPTDEQAETAQPETQQPQEPQQEPETTQAEITIKQTTVQAVPLYSDAMNDISRELRAMKNATTRDELEAAETRCYALIEKYKPFYPDGCERRIPDVKYYVEAFNRRQK